MAGFAERIMSNSYTPSLQLAMPATGDRGWNSAVNGNATVLDVLNPVGDLNVTTAEFPSATLNINVAAGLYVNQTNVVTTFAAYSSFLLAASVTNYVYLNSTGVLTANSTGFPSSPAIYTPLAKVITLATSVQAIIDQRACFNVVGSGYLPLAGGTLADGANVALGSSTGTQIGTSATQKLAFLGATPVVQQPGGVATAGASYTAAEQAMLNKCYSALRSFGLML